MRFRVLATVGILFLATLVLGCGSPDPAPKTFPFTPVPYTVVPQASCPFCGQAVAIDDNGGRYYADQVSLLVAEGREPALMKIIDLYGFTVVVREHDPRRSATRLVVRVPIGAALAAKEFFATQEGVLFAELHGIATIGSSR